MLAKQKNSIVTTRIYLSHFETGGKRKMPGMIPPPTIPMRNYDRPSSSTADNVMPAANEALELAGQSLQKNTKKEKKKTVVRVAGSSVWEDSSLLDWDPSILLFCLYLLCVCF